MQIDGSVDELINRVIGEAQEQFIFQRSPITPREDRSTVCGEGILDGRRWLNVIIAQESGAVSERAEGRGTVETPVGITAAAIDQCDAARADRFLALSRSKLIETAHQPHFACALARQHARRKKCIWIQADRALNSIGGSDLDNFMTFTPATDDEQLISRKLPQDDGRMRGHE